MFDQLIKLVGENAQDAIVNNNAIPNQHNEAAINEAGSAIHNGIQQALNSGQMDSVMSMFNNGGGAQSLASNPVVSNIISSLAGNIGSKFGVDAAQAQNIANSLIPQVMNQFVNKTNDPNDASFNLQDIVGKFAGGNSNGLGDVVNNLFK